MTSGPIIPWQIDGETMETVIDFIFLGSQITAMKLKALAPWKKSKVGHSFNVFVSHSFNTSLIDSILKSRDIT